MQEAVLEQWYWHTLYFKNWVEATKAQKKIRQALDQCCDLNPDPSANNHYAVTFSTNYPFHSEHQQGLIELIGPHVDFETVFNQPGEDAEDLFKGFRWSEPEKSSSSKTRMHVADDLCTLCGMRPRASYGLWCVTCKRAQLKSDPSGTSQSLDEPDLCPLCDMPRERGLSHKVLIEAGKYLWVSLILIIASLVLTLFVGLVALLGGICGILAGIALWFLEETER
jgi:hypothetical protein